MWSNETFKCWLFLVGFTHLFFPASHRRVPSVSFVCLLNFHKHLPFRTKAYCALQSFVPVHLVTPCLSSLCAHLEWIPKRGACMGLGWFCCPQLNWASCTEVAYERTSILCRIFFYDSRIPWGKESLGWDVNLNTVIFIWLFYLPNGRSVTSWRRLLCSLFGREDFALD